MMMMIMQKEQGQVMVSVITLVLFGLLLNIQPITAGKRTKSIHAVSKRTFLKFDLKMIQKFNIFIMVLSGTKHMKFNRSQFYDLTDPCSRTGQYEAVINRSHPALLVKLDTRYRTLVTYQTFDCLIRVKTEFLNKSQETYNENEDIAVMMFDVSHGYIR